MSVEETTEVTQHNESADDEPTSVENATAPAEEATVPIQAATTLPEDAPVLQEEDAPLLQEKDTPVLHEEGPAQPREGTDPAHMLPMPPPPAPATMTSVNVGQMIWALIVIMSGILLCIVGLVTRINIPLLLIGSLILLGLGLIIAAVATARRENRS